MPPLHDSRTCPMCQGIIHGKNPRPQRHQVIVGEHGPELWLPNKPGQIIPGKP